MFCKNCGKELSDNAFMCPDCGEPTDRTEKKAEPALSEPLSAGGRNLKALTVVGFILSVIAFVTGAAFGAFFYADVSRAWVFLFLLDGMSVLPALAGLALCVYALVMKPDGNDKVSKPLAIVSIVLAGVVLLFLFISCYVIVAR